MFCHDYRNFMYSFHIELDTTSDVVTHLQYSHSYLSVMSIYLLHFLTFFSFYILSTAWCMLRHSSVSRWFWLILLTRDHCLQLTISLVLYPDLKLIPSCHHNNWVLLIAIFKPVPLEKICQKDANIYIYASIMP